MRLLTFVFALFWLLAPPLAAQTLKPLRVVTDIEPVAALLRQLAPGAEIDTLINPGVSPHDFALKPSDIRSLQRADLIVWLGQEATPGLAGAMSEGSIERRAITLNDLPGTQLLPFRHVGVYMPHTSADIRVSANGSHHDGMDPHTWLQPENALVWADEIAKSLGTLDPAGAGAYRSAARSLKTDITDTTRLIERRLNRKPLSAFVQFHDAFQYFETRFALYSLGAATVEDEEGTSLGILTDLRKALSRAGDACVFVSNPGQNHRALSLLEIEGVRLGQLDAIGRDFQKRAFTYPEFLKHIAEGFATCLQPEG